MDNYTEIEGGQSTIGPSASRSAVRKLMNMVLDENSPLYEEERKKLSKALAFSGFMGFGGMFGPPLVIGWNYRRPTIQRLLFSSREPSFFRLATVMFISSIVGRLVVLVVSLANSKIFAPIGSKRINRTVESLNPSFVHRYNAYNPSVNDPADKFKNKNSWTPRPASRPEPFIQDQSRVEQRVRQPMSRWSEIRQRAAQESNNSSSFSNVNETSELAALDENTASHSMTQEEFDALLKKEREMANQDCV